VIAAGGTGLYFTALTEGLAAIPAVSPDIRRGLAERLAAEGSDALHGVLRRRDPLAAEPIPPSDAQRILRALEVLEGTGRSILDWRSEQDDALLIRPAETARFIIEPPRAALYARIEERFDRMVEAGALSEVEALLARRLDPTLPAMKAIGVQAFASYHSGASSLDDAVARAKMETRRYAKRQTTWFRNRMPGWARIPG
jgi:tRNA dimethylallyltransferase